MTKFNTAFIFNICGFFYTPNWISYANFNHGCFTRTYYFYLAIKRYKSALTINENWKLNRMSKRKASKIKVNRFGNIYHGKTSFNFRKNIIN